MVRKYSSLLLVTIVSLCAVGRAGALPHAWSKSFGDGLDQYAPYVATDGLGNAFVAGTFLGTIELGGLGFWSAGMADIFLAKFDSNGNHIWSRSFGDPLSQWVNAITVDASGNVTIAGDFHGTVNFGGGPLTSSGDRDIFLAKYDADGTHLWSRRFGDGWAQNAHGVAVDAAENILLAGMFAGTVDFGGGPMHALIEVPDAYVAKFDSGGNHIWSQEFGDHQHYQSVDRITADGVDNAIITGWYEGDIDFGGGPLPTAADGQSDMFLVQFDASGAHNWSHGFAATGAERCFDVAIDSLDGIFISGDFVGNLDLGGGPVTSAGWDVFLARFDQGGSYLWSQRFGDASAQGARTVVADGAGNVYIGGSFLGTVDFGGGPLTTAGLTDIFLAQFDLNGNHIWSQRFGDSASQEARDLATCGAENLFVTGQFQGSVDFGGGALTCAGGLDIFVAKFGESSGPDFTLGDFAYVFEEPSIWVRVELRNIGPGNAQAVSAQMSEDFSWLRITDSHCFYGDIPEGGSSWGADGDSYTLRLLSGYPGGSIDVWLTVAYEDAAGDPHEVVLDLTLPDPNVTGVGDPPDEMHAAIRLLPNRPNPFNPNTLISFEMPRNARADLLVFNVTGELVRTLWSGELPAGIHSFPWSGTGAQGNAAPAGTYYYQLRTEDFSRSGRMVLLR